MISKISMMISSQELLGEPLVGHLQGAYQHLQVITPVTSKLKEVYDELNSQDAFLVKLSLEDQVKLRILYEELLHVGMALVKAGSALSVLLTQLKHCAPEKLKEFPNSKLCISYIAEVSTLLSEWHSSLEKIADKVVMVGKVLSIK